MSAREPSAAALCYSGDPLKSFGGFDGSGVHLTLDSHTTLCGRRVIAEPTVPRTIEPLSCEACARLNSLMERIRRAEDVAEAADHYTDLIAQAKPVDYGDEAWQMLVKALNAWRPRARQQ